MRFFQILSFISFSAATLSQGVYGNVFKIPNAAYGGKSCAEYKSGMGQLDSQKVTPWPNSTSYDWWYFDVVSTSSANESVTIVFLEALPSAFERGVPNSLLSVMLSGTFANGTVYMFQVAVSNTSEGGAIIQTQGDGASGDWLTSGFSFQGTGDLTKYTVKINEPSLGIQGTVVLNSVSPAHYPCGPNVVSASEVMLPGVGWANAIPDANAAVNLKIGGSEVSFSGLGYHDKNWGDMPFKDAVQSWYWGHGRLGPYSLVWFDARSRNGTEYVSGYVAKDGVIISGTCESGAVKVRPFGANNDYPPTPSTGVPEGYTLDYDLGGLGILKANITTQIVLVPEGISSVYARYMGRLVGSLRGENLEGKALWEQFKYPL